jgi:preprotein translocase subunit YajC
MEILILAQAQTGANPLLGWFPLLAMLALFYVLLIMPQRKQQKEHQKMVAALQKGDHVVTNGGLIGEIVGVKEDQILLKTGQSTVVVERAPVARRTAGPGAPAEVTK